MGAPEQILLKVLQIGRKLNLDRLLIFWTRTYPFTNYFKGFEKVEAVKQIFGDKTEEVLRNLRVQFFPMVGYMGTSNSDGHLMINPRYLNNGDRVDVYLDIIHELVHVRQFMMGKELFDTHFDYAKRPTEIEAYRYTVEEARRIGLSDKRICECLKTEWMSNEDLRLLAKSLNVKCDESIIHY